MPAPQVTMQTWSTACASIVCAHIDLARFGHDWPSEQNERLVATYLTPEEIRQFERFTVRKRRLEWLAARLALKQALRCFRGRRFSLPAISIHRLEDGRLFIDDQTYASISHSRDHVLGVVGDVTLGVDVERYAAVKAESVAELIRPHEIAAVAVGQRCSPQEARTLIWCFKEALFKACGAGGFAAFAAAVAIFEWRAAHSPQWKHGDDTERHRLWRTRYELTPTDARVLVYGGQTS